MPDAFEFIFQANKFTSELNQFTFRVNEFTSDLNQFTFRVNEFTSDLNQFRFQVNEFTSDLNQFTFQVNEFTSDPNQFTSRVNEFTSDLNQFTSRVNEFTSDPNQFTFQVNEFTSDPDPETDLRQDYRIYRRRFETEFTELQNEQGRSGAKQDCYPFKSYFFFAFLLLDFFGEEVLAFLPFFGFLGATPPPFILGISGSNIQRLEIRGGLAWIFWDSLP
jgi:archaellum component FlaC